MGTNFETGLKVGGVEITATPAELNTLDGITATTAELNKLEGAGAVVASGTQESKIADIANDASGTAIATAVNSIIDALEAFGISATE
jgi:hypothetical protein